MCFIVAVLGLQLSEEVQVVNQLIDARDAHRKNRVVCERPCLQ